MAVGTRRLTFRSVDSLTAPTLMMVTPTTHASSAQSTLKPRIKRPRIFKFRIAIAKSPSMQADIYRQHFRLGVNHEESDNGRTVLVRNSAGKIACHTIIA